MNFLTVLKLWERDRVQMALARVIRQKFTKTTFTQVRNVLDDAADACEACDGAALAEAITELLFRVR